MSISEDGHTAHAGKRVIAFGGDTAHFIPRPKPLELEAPSSTPDNRPSAAGGAEAVRDLSRTIVKNGMRAGAIVSRIFSEFLNRIS